MKIGAQEFSDKVAATNQYTGLQMEKLAGAVVVVARTYPPAGK